MEQSLKVIPLGGLGEIGKNMMALEYDDDIVVIDAGVLFPDEGMLGVDLVIPDISYLKENRDKVRAILITHGHEDHIGALPYVLRDLNVPVYAPRLAAGLIEVKLKEHRSSLPNARLEAVDPGEPVQLGKFRVEWFRVCHSIPDAMGLAIQTPLGLVIHTGDFKIDHTPVDGLPTDLGKLAALTAKGVLLLCSDSTYAEVPGYTPSERVVGAALERAISEAPGRVLVATFASLISRIQLVLNAAEKHGRKVTFVGRSMVDNVNMALKMGYISTGPDVIATLRQIRDLPPEQVVIMTTGSQGEPTSALVRIANQDHRDVSIMAGDTVIISATPIPGNETVVSKTIDNLLRQGAQVLHDKIALVHVHGHASQEELKLMLNLVKPKYFVPVHGEYRHLKAHVALAHTLGISKDNTFVMEDGDVLEITPQFAELIGRVTAGPVFVDGLRVWDMNNVVLRDRKLLSKDGIVVMILTQEKKTGRLLQPPEMVSSGFIEMGDHGDLSEETAEIVMEALNHGKEQPLERGFIITKVKETVGTFLHQRTGRRPMIIPVVVEV
ncbi:MAG: ribonuclease J [Chloroflexi bacterium]|nr:ribonuclease J [Chloroflexota bacterium]